MTQPPPVPTLACAGLAFEPLAGEMPAWRVRVDRGQWRAISQELSARDGQLLTVWGLDRGPDDGGAAVRAAYATPAGLLCVELPLGPGEPYPDLVPSFPCAVRLQRALCDLSGLHAEGARDTRPWLDHGLWPRSAPPLARAGADAHADDAAPAAAAATPYDFVRVEGDGVHEIAVGPVHAGIIEPGHFRFSVVGEKVLRLEERLGYVHKGIELRFTQLPALQAPRLAGRVSGDSTVAYAWACCMALESACDAQVPPRATWLRALMLERERVANHLGDLGALGNDAALAFGLAQFSRLREQWQRLSGALFGHRLMMDVVQPGGTARDLDAAGVAAMRQQCDQIAREVRRLRGVYDEHPGLQDRLRGTGRVPQELALRLNLCGLAGRASGLADDLRADQPWAPYRALQARAQVRSDGDVAARVAVRFDEVFESLRMIRALCLQLPAGPTQGELHLPDRPRLGLGRTEGWRGEVLVALDLAAGGRVLRGHCHDPSWQNWPVLEHAIIGNIVADFPLINKSFNLSYSGHDL